MLEVIIVVDFWHTGGSDICYVPFPNLGGICTLKICKILCIYVMLKLKKIRKFAQVDVCCNKIYTYKPRFYLHIYFFPFIFYLPAVGSETFIALKKMLLREVQNEFRKNRMNKSLCVSN